MNVLVLGPLEVWRDGQPLVVRRGRPRRLMLSLLLRQGGPVPPETLIDQLWGDEPPENADNALQILVSYLRKAVGGDGLTIERAPTGYRLLVDPSSVDMVRFESMVRAAGAADIEPQDQLDLVTEALSLWRGPALSEAADDDFAQGDIVRLNELRLQAYEARAGALLALGRHEEALPDLGQLVREHPFRERMHAQLALGLYRAGRQADALRALDTVRNALVEELGLDPSAELQELAQQILTQDAALNPPAAAHRPRDQRSVVAVPRGADPAEPLAPEVPMPLTALIGRADQVEAVTTLMGHHRVVTLTGPGGAGKTRLAAEVAAGRSVTVWWCDLSSAEGSGEVAAAIAASMGTGLASDGDQAGTLQRWVGRRRALLVLDTCERVVAGASGLVVALTAGCPGLQVLCTSRQPLGVHGELAWPVPPLSLPDPDAVDVQSLMSSFAVQLFCERAASARPGFTLSSENAADVAAICLLLDGLPLAIELAASHVSALSPAKISSLLGDRMRLVGDGQGRRGRHAGLRATIDWSYGLLSIDEAAFLERLSVFNAPFTVEAAVEVAGPGLDADGLTLLLSLVRQSLVAVAEGDRFRLLDTIRAYADARLADRAVEAEAARDRHAMWAVHFAEEADKNLRNATHHQGWLDDLRLAAPDLRAALRHCFDVDNRQPELGARLVWALSWFWSFEGSFAEARMWIAEASAAGPHDGLLEARLRLAAGMHAESVGDLAAAERELCEAHRALAALGDVRGEARSLLHLGTVHWAQGRAEEAAAAQERAVALFRDARHDSGTGLALVQRARTALDGGDTAAAHALLADARHVLARLGDDHLAALCVEQQARTYLYEGDHERAEVLARHALSIFESVGYAEGVVASLQTLGQARLDASDGPAARALLLRAASGAADLSHAAALAEGLELLGEAHASTCPQRAGALLAQAARIRADGDLPRTRLQQRRLSRWASEDHAPAAPAGVGAMTTHELLDDLALDARKEPISSSQPGPNYGRC